MFYSNIVVTPNRKGTYSLVVLLKIHSVKNENGNIMSQTKSASRNLKFKIKIKLSNLLKH